MRDVVIDCPAEPYNPTNVLKGCSVPDARADTSAKELQRRWKDVLGMVEVQIGNQADFNAFLTDTQATDLVDGALTVAVKNGFIAAWINQRVMPSLERLAEQVFGEKVTIKLKAREFASSDVLLREGLAGDYDEWATISRNRHRTAMASENARFFPTVKGCTFERFEASESNAVAFNAAKNVVETPGDRFNPLTIASETGQGKTHLLNAIAVAMRAKKMNVICLKCEEFVDSFVKATRSQTVVDMRDRFRGVDALIVDGIEKLIGREGTKTFFLSTIDHLIANRKQLVFAFNDAYPMHELGEEITSRIAGGLQISILAPDLELQKSVLRRYARERNLPQMDDDAFAYLSNIVVSNVSEIIGGIARVNAHQSIASRAESATSATITRDFVIDATRDRLTTFKPTSSSPEDIINAVAKVFNIDAETLRKPGRGNQSLSTARDVAFHMLCELGGLSSTDAGVLMGGRKHSTILAGLNRYAERRATDPQLMEAERQIERLLR